jgi:quercetin dioxygenase-like cupin family protein
MNEIGGDAACWAHLFEETTGEPAAAAVDLVALAEATERRGPIWTDQCDDLNVNLLVFASGEGVPDHVNAELDVLIVGICGEGQISIDGATHSLGPGQAILVSKGAVRGTRAVGKRFAYLTCHRRRPGLMPRPVAAKSPPEYA